MQSKKGAIELSMSFIVIILISIVIFAFGVNFIYKLATQANQLKDLTYDELDEKIGNLVCEGSDRVCIGQDHKTINKGDFDVFGIKILNINNEEGFTVDFSPPKGFTKEGTQVPDTEVRLVRNPPFGRTIQIPKNEEKSIGLGIQVLKNAVSGSYIIDVNIQNMGNEYVPVQKLYVEVP